MKTTIEQHQKPRCVLITGRPGSGKSTLAEKLSKELYLPKISRDEFKEGYVNTFGVKHNELPSDTNGIVNQVFFKTIRDMLQGNVSLIIEAAFGHDIWDYIVPDIMKYCDLYIVVCNLDGYQSAKRHLERGLANPKREFYHGDKRVSVFRETGKFEPGGQYFPPKYDVPTLFVSTLDGYDPNLVEIEEFILYRRNTNMLME